MLKRIPLLCCLFFACFASAKQAVPSFTAPLVDQAGFLSPQERQVINGRLSTFAASTRGQMGVLIIPNLQSDESLEGYSLRAAETWGVGKKKEDTGLLLLIVTEPRLLRVEVGYGWEGQINDARAGDLIRELSAAFRNGRKASGILSVIDQAETMITGKTISRGGESRRSDKTQRPLTRGEQILILIVAGIVVILFIVSPEFRLMVIYLVLSGRGGGRGGYSGGGFGGGGGGGFGGGGASGRW